MKPLALACCVVQFVTLAFGIDEIPPVNFMSIIPVGLRVFIPHRNGMSQVTFDINYEHPLPADKTGDYSAILMEPFNGHWSIETTPSKRNYTYDMYYRISVQYGSENVKKEGSAKVYGSLSNIYYHVEESPVEQTLPSGCVSSVTTVNGRPVCKGELIFEDNFDFLNWTMWSREERIPLDDVDAEFVSFQRRPENFYVSNGKLHIVPTLLQDVPGFNETSIKTGTLDLRQYCTGVEDSDRECFKQAMFAQILPPVVAARARTRHFFSFRYGKVEVRAKVPKGDWIFPLILLEPLENYYGFTNHASGQMRIAFVRGNEYLLNQFGVDSSGKQLTGGVVLTKLKQFQRRWLKSTSENVHFGNDFHDFTLTWTHKTISLEVDGTKYSVVKGAFSAFQPYLAERLQVKRWENHHYMAPFDREFYLTLGVAVGGHSGFADRSRNGIDRRTKPWTNYDPKAALNFWKDRNNWLPTWQGENAALQVDYVKVYAL